MELSPQELSDRASTHRQNAPDTEVMLGIGSTIQWVASLECPPSTEPKNSVAADCPHELIGALQPLCFLLRQAVSNATKLHEESDQKYQKLDVSHRGLVSKRTRLNLQCPQLHDPQPCLTGPVHNTCVGKHLRPGRLSMKASLWATHMPRFHSYQGQTRNCAVPRDSVLFSKARDEELRTDLP